jgi:hypothetical protein
MPDPDRIATIVAELEVELRESEDRVEKLRRLLEAAQDFLPGSRRQPLVVTLHHSAEEFVPVNGKGRPPLKQAILTFLRQGGTDGISLAALTEALWQRGWVGATKDGKPSRESVRGALLDLRRQGLVAGKAEGDTSWEPTMWRLSNKPLSQAPDLYSEGR